MSNLKKMQFLIQKKYGLHFPEEKNYLLISRIERSTLRKKFNTIEEYIDFLLLNEGRNIEFIINDITTNFTLFYREEHHFSYLNNFFKGKYNDDITIWSAGCSTGEEVYSIADSIHSLSKDQNIRYKILGSDLSDKALIEANKNSYDIKENFISKFNGQNIEYSKEKLSFSQDLIKNIKFKIINLKNGWNRSYKFNIIFCRNVVIYFDEKSKDELWGRLSSSLYVGGEIYIGHSERIQNPERYGLKVFGINAYRKVM